MPTGAIVADPFTGQGTVTLPDGSQYEASVSEFSGGRYKVINGVFIDTQNPTANIFIGRSGPLSLQALTDDRFSLVSQTRQGLINHTASNDYLRMVSGTVTASLEGGDIVSFDIAPIPVTGVQRQWVVHTPVNENGEPLSPEYVVVKGPYANNAELQADYGVAFRLATSEEAAYQAVFKRLITMNQELLERVIDEHGIEGETPQKQLYNAAKLIMGQLDWSGIKAYNSYILE